MSDDSIARDDPDAATRLANAVRTVASVFGKYKGFPNWGDCFPHHPHQVAGLSQQAIEKLHERPALLPCDALDDEEVYYFFGHAGWTESPEKHLPAAIRYFLPCLAKHTLPAFVRLTIGCDIPRLIGSHFAKVRWQRWPVLQSDAIRGWLLAWAEASLRFEHDEWFDKTYTVDEPSANRDPSVVLDLVAKVGLPPPDLRALLDDLDESHTVRLAAHVLLSIGLDHADAVANEWASDMQTQEKLMRAATSNLPWSELADFLFHRTN